MAVRTPCRWWSRNTCASAVVTYVRADGVVKAAVLLTIGGLLDGWCAPPQPLPSSPSQLLAETLLAEMLFTATLPTATLAAASRDLCSSRRPTGIFMKSTRHNDHAYEYSAGDSETTRVNSSISKHASTSASPQLSNEHVQQLLSEEGVKKCP